MFNKLKDKLKSVKGELAVLSVAYRDKRTPLLPKILLGLTIGYMLSPIDLIPDFIPVLGLLDDLVIVPLLIRASIRMLPKEVVADARKEVQANAMQQKRPANWLAAVVIIGIWAMAALIVFNWLKQL